MRITPLIIITRTRPVQGKQQICKRKQHYISRSDHTFERQPFLKTTPSWSPLVNIMESKFRARANTLERTEHIRPPPRKRRPSTGEYEPSVSGLANMRLRSGSVPPALEPSKMEIGGEAEQPSRPRRMRRLTTRLALDCPASSLPSSGHNTPCINTAPASGGSTSSLDLCQLTPFGTLETSHIQKGSCFWTMTNLLL